MLVLASRIAKTRPFKAKKKKPVLKQTLSLKPTERPASRKDSIADETLQIETTQARRFHLLQKYPATRDSNNNKNNNNHFINQFLIK